MLIYGQDERLLPWAAERIGIERFRDDARAIGIGSDDKIRGVVVYDLFTKNDCNLHVASDQSGYWLTREFLVHVFAFPFIQCGLLRVTGMVAASNSAALKFDEHIGFVREGLHPRSGPNGEDMISLGLLRENCRWIPRNLR